MTVPFQRKMNSAQAFPKSLYFLNNEPLIGQKGDNSTVEQWFIKLSGIRCNHPGRRHGYNVAPCCIIGPKFIG